MKIGLSHHFWSPPLESYLGPELAHKLHPPTPLDPTKGVPKDKMRGIPWYTIVRRTLWTVFKDLRPLCHELCHGTSLRGSKFAALFLWGSTPSIVTGTAVEKSTGVEKRERKECRCCECTLSLALRPVLFDAAVLCHNREQSRNRCQWCRPLSSCPSHCITTV